jgi:FtsH-binding integral membrane protein
METYAYNTHEQQYDMGLRNYLLSVFSNMSIALVISGVVSAWIGLSPDLAQYIWASPLKWVALFLPLVMSLIFAFVIDKIDSSAAKMFLWIFAAAMGLSLSSIFLIFKLGSIFQVFFISAATFGSMALWGYVTKRDLSSMGSFLMMGLIGMMIAGVVNIFLQSSIMTLAISAIGVLIFTLLTAYDMQTIKETYYDSYGEERKKAGIVGALNLYLDFINIFINLLQLIGDRK